jgi:inorganic pyrophosphatase
MQDTKKNLFTKKEELRFYAQFPLFNYGYIPQTWEQNITKNALGLYVKHAKLRVTTIQSTSAT